MLRVMCIQRAAGRRSCALIGALSMAEPRLAAGHEAPASALEGAKERSRAGQSKANAGDLAGAIVDYTAAYELVPPGPEFDIYRDRALLARVFAHRRVYEQSQTDADLCATKDILADLLDGLAEPLAEHRGELETLQAQVDARCSPIVEPPAQPEAVGPPKPKPKPTPTPTPSLDQKTTPVFEPKKLGERPLLVSGGLLTGIGLAALGGMTAGLVLGAQAKRRFDMAVGADLSLENHGMGRAAYYDGQRANHLATAMGILGGALTVTGAVLVAIGVKRRGTLPRASLVPAFDSHYRAVGIRLKF